MSSVKFMLLTVIEINVRLKFDAHFSRMFYNLGACLYCYTPRKLCLWEGILFSRCPTDRVSETFLCP